jgi:hypothetical protein
MSTLQLSSVDAPSRAWVAGPLVAAVGIATRPFVTSYLDTETIARVAAENPTRWVGGSLLIAAGYSLGVTGLVRGFARRGEPGERLGVPALILAASALAYQFGASGVGIYGTVQSGGDVVAYLEQAGRWETPVLVAGIVLSESALGAPQSRRSLQAASRAPVKLWRCWRRSSPSEGSSSPPASASISA